MAATVGATLSGVTFPLRHAGLGPFISSGGNVYFFGRDSVNTGQVEPHKATDPMSAFTAQTLKTMSSGTGTAIEAMACFQVGQVVHVATQISTGATYYNSYTMDTDTWSLTTSETAVAAASFAPTSTYTWVSLIVRSTGEPVIGYCAGQTAMSSGFNMVRYTRRTGTNTYSSPVNVDNGGSVNWTNPVVVLGASDRVHFFFNDNTANDAYQRTLTAANALQTFPASYDTSPYNTGVHIFGPGTSYASGGNTEVRAPYLDSSQLLSVAAATSADAPTASQQTSVSGGSITSFSATTQMPRIALAADGTTTHALYTLADQDLSHTNDSGTGTWVTATNELTATLNYITTNVYTRGGNRYLAMVLDDGGTVKYAEITLTAATTNIHRRLISTAALTRSNRY